MHRTLHALDSITIAVPKTCSGSQKLKIGHVTQGTTYDLLLQSFPYGPQPSIGTLNFNSVASELGHMTPPPLPMAYFCILFYCILFLVLYLCSLCYHAISIGFIKLVVSIQPLAAIPNKPFFFLFIFR